MHSSLSMNALCVFIHAVVEHVKYSVRASATFLYLSVTVEEETSGYNKDSCGMSYCGFDIGASWAELCF